MNLTNNVHLRNAIAKAHATVKEQANDDDSLFQWQLIDLMEGIGASEDHDDVKKELANLPLTPAAVDLLHLVVLHALNPAPTFATDAVQ